MAPATCYGNRDHEPIRVESCGFEKTEETISNISDLGWNLLYEVLRRVDAATLARVSCLNQEFRSVSNDEILWKDLCNERWPSTRNSRVKSLLSLAGGYQNFYSQCFPCIVGDVHLPPQKCEETSSSSCHDGHHQSSHLSSSDFIFMVDVVYEKSSIFSKVVDGVAGPGDLQNPSTSSPFQLDLIDRQEENFHDTEDNAVTSAAGGFASNNVRSLKIMETPVLPKTTLKKLRLSWILVNRKTGQAANLASWTPLSVQHWLSSGEFLLKFGSVLPGLAIPTSTAGSFSACPAVQCDISLQCSLKRESEEGAPERTLRLTQISFHLEDFGGSILKTEDALKILQQALTCPKTVDCKGVVDSYYRYVEAQDQVLAKHKRHDHRLNVRAAISSAILYCVFFLWMLKFS